MGIFQPQIIPTIVLTFMGGFGIMIVVEELRTNREKRS